MAIVTFISDFGTMDYYSAVIKGALLSEDPQLNLVDISHNIKTYDIVQGAFVLKNAYQHFPAGTIHLVSVNNFYAPNHCFLAIRYDDHYFIGPDNGLFALAFEKEQLTSVYELAYRPNVPNPLGDVFAKGVRHILSEMPFNEIGIPIETIEERISIQPVTTIDNYLEIAINLGKASSMLGMGIDEHVQIDFQND